MTITGAKEDLNKKKEEITVHVIHENRSTYLGVAERAKASRKQLSASLYCWRLL
jgi:hypothetical protein